MTFIRHMFVVLLAAVSSVAQASACQFGEPPTPSTLFWNALPELVGPEEIALEVVYQGPENVDWYYEVEGDRVVVGAGCGAGPARRYKVVRLLAGSFEDAEVVIVPLFQNITDGKDTTIPRVVVGQLATLRRGALEGQTEFFVPRLPPE